MEGICTQIKAVQNHFFTLRRRLFAAGGRGALLIFPAAKTLTFVLLQRKTHIAQIALQGFGYLPSVLQQEIVGLWTVRSDGNGDYAV